MPGVLYENINVLLEKSIHIYIEDDDYGDDSIFNDDGIYCDIEDSTFMNRYDTGVGKYYDNNFFGSCCKWYKWTFIGDDDDVTGPPMNDNYNGRCGFKPGVAALFDHILNFLLKCTVINNELFQILA